MPAGLSLVEGIYIYIYIYRAAINRQAYISFMQILGIS